MPYRAFVSSTFVDLKDHRAHVINSLRRAGFAVDPMEDWTADSNEPKNFSQDRLNGCDLCVLLVAFRRGYVPDAEALSITQLEYEAALKQGIDILPFMLDDNAPWPRKFDELEKDPEIVKWRADLRKRHGVETFNLEPRSIDMTGALGRWLAKRPVPPAVEPPAVLTKIIWDISKDKDGSPYPGLMHFTRKYARVFFGRDDEIREILYRMRQPEGRFTVISGDSGVGKSSVVDAGILPKLENGGLPGSEPCVTVRMVPGQTGEPFDAFMTALGSLVTRAGLAPDAIVKDLKQSPNTLTRHLEKIVADGADGKTGVLFLDQMEELFTAQDVEQSNKFLAALYRAVQEKALWVIATIRSDHLQFCHRHPDMLQVLRGQGHYPLGRVEPFMVYDMIVKPANCAGLKVSDNLARHIVNDTASQSANLPLLAFVLNQLFEKRSDHELSEKVYKDLGGVGGAIAEHVKTVEEKMRQDLGKKTAELLPEIFQSLVIVNPEGLPTRRRPLRSGFSKAQDPVVRQLTDDRLLDTEGEGEAATVSISHEKLFEAWPALRDYISINKKSLMDQTLLENRARKWIEMGKPWFGGLASGRELKDFRCAGVVTPQAKSYLAASDRAWWTKAVGGLALALVFGFIARAWQQGLSVEHTWLKLRSAFAGIHVEPEMVEVKAGTFQMGDVAGRGDKELQPVHEVKLQKSFKLGKHEVTFDEYDRFALVTGKPLPHDQRWGRDRRPVINVSWEDARDFAIWLSKQTGKRYRLPSEAEWEYAARSGGKDEVWAGTSDENQLGDYAVFLKNQTEPADERGRKPNGLGLYDMTGNVWEWVEDCWHRNYDSAPSDERPWKEENGGECGQRVVRGGSWYNEPVNLRASARDRLNAVNRGFDIGFRLAQDLE